MCSVSFGIHWDLCNEMTHYLLYNTKTKQEERNKDETHIIIFNSKTKQDEMNKDEIHIII